jgi:tetratricopeptide (TPR) repeat protein
MEQTVKSWNDQYGPDNPSTLFSSGQLAMAYRQAGRMNDAIALHEKTLPRCRAKLGPLHYMTQERVYDLAIAYRDAGQPAKALPLLRESFDARHANGGRGFPWTQVALGALADTSTQLGDHALAEPPLRELLAVQEKEQPAAWTTFHTKARLGVCLLGQKKYSAAEPLLLAGYEGLKQRETQVVAARKDLLPQVLNQIVQLYDGWGKGDLADAWRRKGQPAGGGP